MKNTIKSIVNAFVCIICWCALQNLNIEMLAGIVTWLVILTTVNTFIDIFVEVLNKIRGRKNGL